MKKISDPILKHPHQCLPAVILRDAIPFFRTAFLADKENILHLPPTGGYIRWHQQPLAPGGAIPRKVIHVNRMQTLPAVISARALRGRVLRSAYPACKCLIYFGKSLHRITGGVLSTPCIVYSLLMKQQSHAHILGVRIDILSPQAVDASITQALDGSTFAHIATVNPEFLVHAHHDADFRALLNATNANICDGFGLSLVGRILHGVRIPRIPGVELADRICAHAAKSGKSVFFLGGRGVADRAAKAMQKKYPDLIIAGTCDGDEHTFEEVARTKPSVVLVAFGSPKQEQWLAQNGKKIPSLRIGVGVGGTFDFWSGAVRRAPRIMCHLGLEWLFRLIMEPKKRIRRIIRAVVVFPWLAIREKI